MIKALSAQASLIDLNVANSPNLRIQLCLDTHTSNFNPKPLLPVHQIFTEFFSLFSFIYLVVKYYEMWIFFFLFEALALRAFINKVITYEIENIFPRSHSPYE